MDKMHLRPTQIRMKSLQYWKNERIHYDIKGDISSVELRASSSSHHFSHLNQRIINIHNENQNGYSSKQQETSTRCASSTPIYNKQMLKESKPKKSREKKVTKEKLKSLANEKKIQEIGLSSNLKRIPTSPTKDYSNLKKKEEKSPQSPPKSTNEENNLDISESPKYTQAISKLIISNELDRTLLTCSTHPKWLDNGHLIDISLLKTELPDQCMFTLDAMDKVVNHSQETYYIEKGPHIPSLDLVTGFIALKSHTLHWGEITFPREIFVIRGTGELRLTPSDAETDHTWTAILEGNTYKIFPRGELIVRKDESCPLLMLFVIFIVDHRGIGDADA